MDAGSLVRFVEIAEIGLHADTDRAGQAVWRQSSSSTEVNILRPRVSEDAIVRDSERARHPDSHRSPGYMANQ